ncbi:hypothetical protein MVEN_02025200 [Mycena venus]|uniref:DUF6534 domain-containing protein n=1 Tax=Mycena venus TaxID=2733690 RepID=A0A8H6XB47_9AGAR|nr:hypothetical protein MVEN_02025200 [Mycena venus]
MSLVIMVVSVGVVEHPVYIPPRSIIPLPFHLQALSYIFFTLTYFLFPTPPSHSFMDISHFPLNPDLGALEIGFLASGFLFGVLTVQGLIYNRKFAKDHWSLKLLVTVIWFLELGQLGCVAHAAYLMTITKSGDLLTLLKPPITIGCSFLLGSAVGPLVEAFYVSRLLRFSGKVYPAVMGWILAFLRFGGWVFLAVHVITMKSLAQFVDDFGWFFAMLLGLSAVVDLTISAWIAYFLARRRSRTRDTMHNESARQLLDRVILWTLQTGVITRQLVVPGHPHLLSRSRTIPYGPLNQLNSTFNMFNAVIWMAVLAILTKVSSNCFLASLNARASTRPRSKNNTSGFGNSQPNWSQNYESANNGVSVVGNIIDMYQADDDHESSHFHTIRRSRASLGNDRSAFSPDGTVISTTSTRSGYWAL